MVFKKSKKFSFRTPNKIKTKKKHKNGLPVRNMKGGGAGANRRFRTDGSSIPDRMEPVISPENGVNVKEKLLFRLQFFSGETSQTEKEILNNLFDFRQFPEIRYCIKGRPKRLTKLRGGASPDLRESGGRASGGEVGIPEPFPESNATVKFNYQDMPDGFFKQFEFDNYMDKTNENIIELNQKLNTPEVVAEDTYITFLDTHGGIRSLDFEVVPEDTIICFLAPINDLSYLSMNDTIRYNRRDLELFHVMNTLTPYQYQELFRYRERIGNRNTEMSYVANTLKLGHTQTHLTIYNCFMNSVFLYPGQVYPNMDLTISSSDILEGGSRNNMNRWQFKFLEIDSSTNSVKNIKASNSVYGVPFYDREDVVRKLRDGGKQMNVELKYVVDYVRPDTQRRIKMVIVPGCRGIYDLDNLSIYYQLEVINQEINRMAMSNYFSKLVPSVPMEGINTTCGFLSYRQVLLNQMNYEGFAKAGKFTRDRNYNFNYSGHIPRLIEIFERVKSDPMGFGEMSVSDAVYLASLTPSKLFRFLKKLKENEDVSTISYELLVDSLIEKAGDLLVENLKKNVGYLNLPLLNSSYFSTLQGSIKDIRRNLGMIQSILDEVFEMDIEMPILREISEDIHRNLSSEKHLATVGGYFFHHFFEPTVQALQQTDIYMIDLVLFEDTFIDYIRGAGNLRTLHIHNKSLNMEINSIDRLKYAKLQILNIIGDMKFSNIDYKETMLFFCEKFPGLQSLSCQNVTTLQKFNLHSSVLKNMRTVILENCNFSPIETLCPDTLQKLHIVKNDSLMMLHLNNYLNLNEILLQDCNKLVNCMSMGDKLLGSFIFRYLIPEPDKKINIFLIHKTIGTLEVDGCNNLVVNLTCETVLDFTIKKSSLIYVIMAVKKIQNLEIEHSTGITNLDKLLQSTTGEIKLREMVELKAKDIAFWKALNILNLDIDADSAAEGVLNDMMTNPGEYKYDININF